MGIVAGSVAETLESMKQKLGAVVPDAEIRLKAELVYEINRLKKEKDAIILGHNYMEPALFHTVPDIVGDSLQLCLAARDATQKIIIFCGVRFMAETAKIVNPDRMVLVPAAKAGCSLAESITAEDVRKLRQQFPGLPIVAYINTYADVKAEVDVCCTSSNAAKVVNSLNSDQVIFLPDEYLAKNVARETGKKIIVASKHTTPGLTSDVSFVGWQGRCEVHEKFMVSDIVNIRQQFPDVVVLAHPECSPEVVEASDFSGSTSKMIDYVQSTKSPRYLLLTECAMGDNIAAENPDKEMVRLCSVRCPHMNEITLEDTLDSLRYNRYEVNVPEDIRVRALRSIERMMEIH